MKKLLFYFLFLVGVSHVFGQQKHIALNWDGVKQFNTETAHYTVPFFNTPGYVFEDGRVFYSYHWLDTGSALASSLQVSNIQYGVITAEELLDIDQGSIPEDIDVALKGTKARDEYHTFVTFNPIVKLDGVFRKVLSLDVSYVYTSGKLFDVPGNANSVLASGKWFKFYVEESGVYRLNRDFLSSLGINMGEVDPRTIKIYGFGGEMLPLLNSENAYFDPPQIPIQVLGEEDGDFGSNDFILFYATGPDRWNEESRTFINAYTDITYYYITYGGANGLRIQNAVQPSGVPSQVITTYDDVQHHEVDRYNMGKLGRRWYGELFNIDSEQTFEFELENLVTTEPVRVTVSVAASAIITTNMDVAVNGSQVMNLPIGAIGQTTVGAGSQGSALVNLSGEDLAVQLSYNNGGNPTSLGYLDYIAVESTRRIAGRGDQFEFTYNDASFLNGIGQYSVGDAGNIVAVWDVTDMYNVSRYGNDDDLDTFTFNVELGEQRNYVVLDRLHYKTPSVNSASRTVGNQNLKATVYQNQAGESGYVDYLIITSKQLIGQAERLANIHRNLEGMQVKVVTLDEIYTEFSTGNRDIAAIRNFIRYVYENAPSDDQKLKYVCMFGDGSYDYKGLETSITNLIPLYHSYPSFSLANSIASDDFYVMLDEDEGQMISSDLMDVAVGRMLVNNEQQAFDVVNKVEDYLSTASYGQWRNRLLLLSDDVDADWEGIIENSLDALGDVIYANKPFVNVEKIHTDAYLQQVSSGGERYPDAKEEFLNKMKLGALVVSYFGHGGVGGLASERMFQSLEARDIENEHRYHLFITVTCDFSRFDNPDVVTGGEYSFLNPKGGAISLISTTREIYVSNGIDYNPVIAKYLYAYGSNEYPTMGEALRRAKVDPEYTTGAQKRVVFYLGDPALKLAMPQPKINLTHVNDVPVTQVTDTLKALSKVKLRGNVTNEEGVLLANYNGVVYATVYDKNIERTTLANDGTTDTSGTIIKMDFAILGEVLFRGQVTVTNGVFEFEFVVPRDALIPVDEGRISFYAYREDFSEDQTGYNTDILVGELNEAAPADNNGPEITLYMNDENFIYGGMTNQSPVLLAYLEDENGINTSSGIGHDIVAILDGDETNPYVLNDYYITELDVYTNGIVTFPFSDLEPGLHTLTFKAWDTYNNSTIAEIQFLVIDDSELKLEKVLNYPNPFVSYTEFWFQHNKPFEPLEVLVQVFTVSGKLVWSHNQTVTTDGYLSRDITWDGKDDFGGKIGKGVYVYKITVKSTLSNKKAEKYEKLVIL